MFMSDACMSELLTPLPPEPSRQSRVGGASGETVMGGAWQERGTDKALSLIQVLCACLCYSVLSERDGQPHRRATARKLKRNPSCG